MPEVARGVGAPTSVILWLADGTEREEVFPTRFQAEWFLAMIPMAAVILEEFAAVRAAMLSPLAAVVESGRELQSGRG